MLHAERPPGLRQRNMVGVVGVLSAVAQSTVVAMNEELRIRPGAHKANRRRPEPRARWWTWARS